MLSRRMDTYCIYDSTPSGTLNPRGERHGCGCESETMDFNLLIMIAMMALLAWMMFSAQKRQRKQMEELRAMQQSLVPGTQVMTGSGIYGTVVSTDLDNNKLQLQIADGVVPGTERDYGRRRGGSPRGAPDRGRVRGYRIRSSRFRYLF